VLTEEKLYEAGSKLEYTPQTSLRQHAQETDISKPLPATAMKLRPYMATVVRALQPHDPANRIEGQSLQNEPLTRIRVKVNTRRRVLEVPREDFLRVNIKRLRECVRVQGNIFSIPYKKVKLLCCYCEVTTRIGQILFTVARTAHKQAGR